MRGLDTNILVRYLTQDDPDQSRQANALIANALGSGQRLYLGQIVLCELVWVLRGAYDLPKSTVVATLDKLLDTAEFEIEAKDHVRRALADYSAGAGGFADYLIGHVHRSAGCEQTATFDRKLRDSPLFEVIGESRQS